MATQRGNKYSAQKVYRGEVKFDSKLERSCYDLLKKLKIPFEFQVTYNLQLGFVNPSGKKIREINCIVDFVVPLGEKKLIIDTKGFPTETSKVKYKLLEYKLTEANENYEVVFLKKKKAMQDYIIGLYDDMKKPRIKQGLFF